LQPEALQGWEPWWVVEGLMRETVQFQSWQFVKCAEKRSFPEVALCCLFKQALVDLSALLKVVGFF